ncbi:hypothetical protein Zmor_004737 [Zophobas morio]|uniref:Uncharacterized protein n=1 Tax=Zophobas morio TaxID=2755281 RepID=A0AA38IUT8_9CUCU|nr:hypothetical protein Zmor_004737 [Zophobas morio]
MATSARKTRAPTPTNFQIAANANGDQSAFSRKQTFAEIAKTTLEARPNASRILQIPPAYVQCQSQLIKRIKSTGESLFSIRGDGRRGRCIGGVTDPSPASGKRNPSGPPRSIPPLGNQAKQGGQIKTAKHPRKGRGRRRGASCDGRQAVIATGRGSEGRTPIKKIPASCRAKEQ